VEKREQPKHWDSVKDLLPTFWTNWTDTHDFANSSDRRTRHQLVTKTMQFLVISDQAKPKKQGRQRDLAAVPHN
jgi:hypothetical protein